MKVLVRFGELMLKGKNKKLFINKLVHHTKNKFKNLEVSFDLRHDQFFLEFDEKLELEVIKRLKEIPGIHSFSVVYTTTKELEDIKELALSVLKKELDNNKKYSFKIESKRADKNYYLTSQEFTKEIAPMILNETNNLVVDVKNPEVILKINIRLDQVFMYLSSIKGMGGFPATIAGKGLLMMSGGIDSPVAAVLAIKQGILVELIHFESTPLTPLESINKVSDLAGKLAKFLPNGKIRLHVVPFFKIHEAILNNISDSYVITIMRRIMYKIAETYANNHDIDVLVNGESVGQVASQTLSSMKVVENVTNIPIIRPLATYDKSDVIDIAKNIDTYNISVRPFNDCCSIYVPKSPVINPTIKRALQEELKFDFEPLIQNAIDNIMSFYVHEEEKIDFSMYGFSFTESFNNWREK